MQIVEIGKEVGTLFKVDASRTVRESARKLCMAGHPADRGIDFRKRLKEFGNVVLVDRPKRHLVQLLCDRLCRAADLPVAPFLAEFFKFGKLLIQFDERFEVLVVVLETGIQSLVRIEEEIELRLVHAHEVLVIRSRDEFFGKFGECADLAQGERGDLLSVKFQKERQERLQVFDLGEHDLAGTEQLVPQGLRILGEIDVVEGRIAYPAAFLGGSRGRENHAAAFGKFLLGE